MFSLGTNGLLLFFLLLYEERCRCIKYTVHAKNMYSSTKRCSIFEHLCLLYTWLPWLLKAAISLLYETDSTWLLCVEYIEFVSTLCANVGRKEQYIALCGKNNWDFIACKSRRFWPVKGVSSGSVAFTVTSSMC